MRQHLVGLLVVCAAFASAVVDPATNGVSLLDFETEEMQVIALLILSARVSNDL